jgi:putative two-component system response regulator
VRLACELARSHHERWDGRDYPEGLKGEATPLSGRVVAVTDVFDALTSERPYKQAWRPEEGTAQGMARCSARSREVSTSFVGVLRLAAALDRSRHEQTLTIYL